MTALLAVTSAPAHAQSRPASGARITYPSHANHFSWERAHGFHGGYPVLVVEREVPVVVEREVVVERQVPPPAPPQAPRKPYVIGNSYASLPGGCMKMIEGGASYYFCGGGEWYRQVGKQYRAVSLKL